jgi:hypothetical protein
MSDTDVAVGKPHTSLCPLPGNPAADKPGTHWRDWEVGGLLAMATEGVTFEDIGAALKRSAAACQKQLERLLAGEAPCPEYYASALELGRKKLASFMHHRGYSAAVCLQTVTEQYRKLESRLEALEEAAVEARSERIVHLALHVAVGRISAQQIETIFGAQMAVAAQQLARELAIVPPVLTGPGGDFTHAYGDGSVPAPSVDVRA